MTEADCSFPIRMIAKAAKSMKEAGFKMVIMRPIAGMSATRPITPQTPPSAVAIADIPNASAARFF